jgi:hypothetical protein
MYLDSETGTQRRLCEPSVDQTQLLLREAYE